MQASGYSNILTEHVFQAGITSVKNNTIFKSSFDKKFRKDWKIICTLQVRFSCSSILESDLHRKLKQSKI